MSEELLSPNKRVLNFCGQTLPKVIADAGTDAIEPPAAQLYYCFVAE